MSLKSQLIRPYVWWISRQVSRWKRRALWDQQQIFDQLIRKGRNTAFGKEHHFSDISFYEDYRASIPLRDYEQLKTYIDRIIAGEEDVLWPGRPKYLAKTSGTTSGVKYIPITTDSIPNHFYSAQTAVMLFMHERRDTSMMEGQMLFLSGSPQLETVGGIKTGRLSGIVNHEIPFYLKRNQVPSWETNCIEDWEMKVERIAEETLHKNMTLISGIPPWVQMYFDRLHEKTGGKRIIEIFPNLQVITHGGVNFEPYRTKLEHSIGKKIPTIETYPASEGFIAFQDSQYEPGLLLNTSSGIFYEFIPTDEIFNEHPKRLWLAEVEEEVNYAIILNTNAGLWSYVLGDTIKFVSRNPYRIVVTGRIKHFISAFGEHVIAEEVEYALREASRLQQVEIVEFTVAPKIQTSGELPHHEWWIEFGNMPNDLSIFALSVDNFLRKKNIYYNDLIEGKVLQPLKIRVLQKGAFIEYMKSKNKLGGQNKVPRLSNDRTIADELEKYAKKN